MKEPLTRNDHRDFLLLAIPLIISTISTPLLGVVDTAVMGRLPDPAYIGGVSVGTLIFNTLFWLFGFLRVSTSGYSAQANGSQSQSAIYFAFLRPAFIALCFGLLFVILQWPIKAGAFMLLSPDQQVKSLAETYYDIRIYGAPFTLLNYVILGWLIGMAKVKVSLFLQVYMNVLNIILDVVFVMVLNFNVGGVAAASLISEVSAFLIGIMIILRMNNLNISTILWKKVFDPKPFIEMMKVNRDLFIRTLCLLTVFNLFTYYGIRYGNTTLAANAVLLQVHFIMAYFLDGFANASSILVGKSIGAKDKALYQKTIRLTKIWGFITAISLSLFTIFIQKPVVQIFTTIPEVQEVALQYMNWVALFPLVAFWGLQLYGVFSGATTAAPIRNSMIYSLVCYLIVLWIVTPQWGNHGLWLSFIVFSLGRSLFLWMYLPGLTKKLFGEKGVIEAC